MTTMPPTAEEDQWIGDRPAIHEKPRRPIACRAIATDRANACAAPKETWSKRVWHNRQFT